MLPFEFVVLGTPISVQAKPRSKNRWKALVKTSAQGDWSTGTPPVTTNVKITVIYYYDGTALDTDNMLKPIQDSLIGVIYVDDCQITDISAGKRNINGSFRVKGLSPTLAKGFSANKEFVYIKIEAAPDHQELI
jgi:crossover junction endodeoxyribonuclease RusA